MTTKKTLDATHGISAGVDGSKRGLLRGGRHQPGRGRPARAGRSLGACGGAAQILAAQRPGCGPSGRAHGAARSG